MSKKKKEASLMADKHACVLILWIWKGLKCLVQPTCSWLPSGHQIICLVDGLFPAQSAADGTFLHKQKLIQTPQPLCENGTAILQQLELEL